MLFRDECTINTFKYQQQSDREKARFRKTDRSNSAVECCQNSPTVNVQIEMGMTTRFIIGANFFEENGAGVNINAERYCHILSKFLIPIIETNKKIVDNCFLANWGIATRFRSLKISSGKFWTSRDFSALL